MSEGMASGRLTLRIDLGETASEEELDMSARQLRRELLELGVEAVGPAEGTSVPEGARSVEALTLGTLAVTLLPTAVPKFIELLRDWLLRAKDRRVSIKVAVGPRSLDVEYNADAMSVADLRNLTETLTKVLEGGGSDRQ